MTRRLITIFQSPYILKNQEGEFQYQVKLQIALLSLSSWFLVIVVRLFLCSLWLWYFLIILTIFVIIKHTSGWPKSAVPCFVALSMAYYYMHHSKRTTFCLWNDAYISSLYYFVKKLHLIIYSPLHTTHALIQRRGPPPPLKNHKITGLLRLLSVLKRWFVVADLLIYVPPIVSGGSVLVFVFGMHYFMSFLVLQSSWWGR